MATLAERKTEYDAHETAGKAYYNEIRSQLTLDIEAGSRTLQDAVAIQQQLHWVAHHLHSGDWKSAQMDINSLNTNDTLTESYLNGIKTYIQNYITTNYTW